jgi:hypothetical protein
MVLMMQQLLLGQTELQTRLENQPRKSVKASNISVTDVDKYFRCGQKRFESVVGSRLSYNDKDKSKIIVDAVVALSLYMQKIPQASWSNCEVSFVQPYVHTTFLRDVVGCLDNAHLVVRERERVFQLEAMDKHEVLPVNGATDHCAKIVDSDCRVFTIEDKTVCKELSRPCIAQTRSEMMVEVRDMFEFFTYRPQRYCGILHNCSEWLFVEREVVGNDEHWSYVKLPPIFTSAISPINEDNCKLVAKFLEHVLKVADSIIEDICNNRFVSTGPALDSIPEYENDDNDDHDHDDDGHVDDEAKTEEQTRTNKNIKPDRRSKRRGTGLSSGHKHNVRTMRVSNAYNATSMSSNGKENAYMPITTENLSMRPTNFIKKF